jgi:hypothetical protein
VEQKQLLPQFQNISLFRKLLYFRMEVVLFRVEELATSNSSENVIGIPVQSHRQIMRIARNLVMAGCPEKSEENKRTRMLSQRENIYGDQLDALE